jgi:hemerythrin
MNESAASLLPPRPASDGLQLGFPEMDRLHADFVVLVAKLADAPVDELPAVLDALLEQSKDHFGSEDRWMQETDFPARECHVEEHAAVLASMEGVRRLLAEGDAAPCRSIAAALIDWFPGHADYLDSALATWMCKRRFGGQPVVLRTTPRDRPTP